MEKIRALVLVSGGLDSILAMKILQMQGIDVIGIHFNTWFNIPKFSLPEDIKQEYEYFGFKVYNIDVSEDYTSILINPRYGYGSSVNPCIDCKILFFSKARDLLKIFNGHFVASGEVIGQRPMTQNLNAMKLIAKKSGLEGLILRPLSAKLLEPTIPEIKGWVDRDKLYDISGRGRRRQMELAEEFGITDYPSPAGGCLLTEKNFAPRFYDLINNVDRPTIMDFLLLRYGRHFRLSKNSKLIVGKHRTENKFLKRIKWGSFGIDIVNIPGPYCLFKWNGSPSLFKLALNICSKYSDFRKQEDKNRVVIFKIINFRNMKEKELRFKPMSGDFDVSKYMVM